MFLPWSNNEQISKLMRKLKMEGHLFRPIPHYLGTRAQLRNLTYLCCNLFRVCSKKQLSQCPDDDSTEP